MTLAGSPRMTSRPLDAYRTVGTTTADPLSLTLILFDEAIRRLAEASRALGRGDVPTFAQRQATAHAIVATLAGSLDHAAGGDIAANLARLYDFMLRHLSEGLLDRSADHLDRVRGMLSELRDGFAGARA
jgi:flagellar protein FliS